MKKVLLILCLALLVGCGPFPKKKLSEVKTETAEIISMNYVPSRSGSDVNVGITFEGDLAITPTSYHFPEVWAVTFRCSEHGQTFALEGKEIFNKAKVGQIVTLNYVDEIQYYEEIPDSEEVVDHHTVKIIFADESRIER